MKRSAFLGISEPKSTRRAVLRLRWNAASDDSDDAKRTAVIRSISMHSISRVCTRIPMPGVTHRLPRSAALFALCGPRRF